MGNVCRVPATSETDVQRVVHGEECFVGQPGYCCAVDDDCMDAFEYQRLEAHLHSPKDIDPVPDPLSEGANCTGELSCPLPRAAAVSVMGRVQERSHRPASFPRCTMRTQAPRSQSQHKAPLDNEEKPVAPVMARADSVDEEHDSFIAATGARPRFPPRSMSQSVITPRRPSPRSGDNMVLVNLYDLSDTFAQLNAVSIDIIGFGGALHVGIEVYGVEWSYGTGGVSRGPPKQHRHFNYRQTVEMERTSLTEREVELAVTEMQPDWRGADYELFTKNCGSFGHALCVRLGVGTLPAWITRLAEAGGKSVTLRRITDMLVRNGVIGDASPQGSESQADPSLQGETTGRSNDFESPPRPQVLARELEKPRALQDWLEEDLGYEIHSPPRTSCPRLPSATVARTSAEGQVPRKAMLTNFASVARGTSLSSKSSASSVSLEIPSPLKGTIRPQRCATFRASSRPKVNTALRSIVIKSSGNAEKDFCAKRLALAPPGYSHQAPAMRIAASGGA